MTTDTQAGMGPHWKPSRNEKCSCPDCNSFSGDGDGQKCCAENEVLYNGHCYKISIQLHQECEEDFQCTATQGAHLCYKSICSCSKGLTLNRKNECVSVNGYTEDTTGKILPSINGYTEDISAKSLSSSQINMSKTSTGALITAGSIGFILGVLLMTSLFIIIHCIRKRQSGRRKASSMPHTINNEAYEVEHRPTRTIERPRSDIYSEVEEDLLIQNTNRKCDYSDTKALTPPVIPRSGHSEEDLYQHLNENADKDEGDYDHVHKITFAEESTNNYYGKLSNFEQESTKSTNNVDIMKVLKSVSSEREDQASSPGASLCNTTINSEENAKFTSNGIQNTDDNNQPEDGDDESDNYFKLEHTIN